MIKFITHTNLVLIKKKEFVQEFNDLRPISLSNFSKKVISRIFLERIVECFQILYLLISLDYEREKHNKECVAGTGNSTRYTPKE